MEIAKSYLADFESQDDAASVSSSALSQRKRLFLLEMAKRFETAVETAQKAGKDSYLSSMSEEKRKPIKLAFSLLASLTQITQIRSAFVSAGLLSSNDFGDRVESEMIILGTEQAVKTVHPYVILQTMSSFLGLEAVKSAEEWLVDKVRHRKVRIDELIIPGDMPDILAHYSHLKGQLEHGIRTAGMELSAAALAGCPRENIAAVKKLFGTIGGAIFEDSLLLARNRLSSDELADAQNAFLELLRTSEISDSKTVDSEQTDYKTIDKDMSRDLTDLVLELDPKVLKTIASGMAPTDLASLLQGMEPLAHDRVLSLLGTIRENRVIDALESSAPLDDISLLREAQIFAQRVLSFFAPHRNDLGKPLSLTSKVRQLLSSILSRE
jgi:hypothetical protein